MKLKSINFSASNAKRRVKFASVNENLLHVPLIIMIVCLLFERIANDLVTTHRFIRYLLRLFANVNASLVSAQPRATDLQPGSFDGELNGLHDCVESFPLGSATSAYGKF